MAAVQEKKFGYVLAQSGVVVVTPGTGLQLSVSAANAITGPGSTPARLYFASCPTPVLEAPGVGSIFVQSSAVGEVNEPLLAACGPGKFSGRVTFSEL